MNTPFELHKTTADRWVVDWPTFKNIRDTGTGVKLLDILFGEIKCHQVGLALLLNNNESETLWIDFSIWATDTKNHYAEYLMDMYEIRGVVFHKEHEAIQFQDILEKKYIWKILQA